MVRLASRDRIPRYRPSPQALPRPLTRDPDCCPEFRGGGKLRASGDVLSRGAATGCRGWFAGTAGGDLAQGCARASTPGRFSEQCRRSTARRYQEPSGGDPPGQPLAAFRSQQQPRGFAATDARPVRGAAGSGGSGCGVNPGGKPARILLQLRPSIGSQQRLGGCLKLLWKVAPGKTILRTRGCCGGQVAVASGDELRGAGTRIPTNSERQPSDRQTRPVLQAVSGSMGERQGGAWHPEGTAELLHCRGDGDRKSTRLNSSHLG